MEELVYLWSFKGDSLEVSFVVVIEERQCLSRVCKQRERLNMYCHLEQWSQTLL